MDRPHVYDTFWRGESEALLTTPLPAARGTCLCHEEERRIHGEKLSI